MHLVIRADGHRAIGAGHVMRCLALAEAWRRGGGAVTFVVFVDSDQLAQRLRAGCDALVRLERPHPSPSDGTRLLEVTAAHPGAPVVVDGYGFDGAYHQMVRAAGHPVLLLDDHAHLPAYDVDWVLNPNAMASPALYRQRGSQATLLLGPTYALLRAEFLVWRDWVRPPSATGARRILVSMGGSDPRNVTLRVLHGLAGALGSTRDAQVRILAGHSNPNGETLREFAASAPFGCELSMGSDDMPGQMTWAELALGAAGVTTWEMAYMQLPSLLVTVADNQGTNAALVAARGAARDLGGLDTGLEARTTDAVRALVDDGGALAAMAAAGRALVDGEGAARVAKVLTSAHNAP